MAAGGWRGSAAGAVAGVVWLGLSAMAAAGETVAPDAALFSAGGVSDAELAAETGLGVNAENVSIGEGNVALGKNNAAAQATSTGTINGKVEAETVRAGDVRQIHIGKTRGTNVFQINTASMVNQQVTQSIIIKIFESAPTN